MASPPRLHGEAVVLRGDLHRLPVEVLHRVVSTVMAEGELVGGAPKAREMSWWPRQMPKTGTSAWARPRMARVAFSTAAGSPGPLDTNRPEGGSARISSARGVRRDDRHPAPALRKEPRGVGLDAEVVGEDVEALLPHGGDLVGLGRGHATRQVEAFHAWVGRDARHHLLGARSAGAMAPRMAPSAADVAGQGAGIHVGDAGDPVSLRYSSRPPSDASRSQPRGLPHDEARHLGTGDSPSWSFTP